MNYEANTYQWRVNDVVIHDADAKDPKMLMRVMRVTDHGTFKTQYVDQRHNRRIYENDAAPLHAPALFKINALWAELGQKRFEEICGEWDWVRRFNYYYPVGTAVRTISADGGFETTTRGPAWMEGDGYAHILLVQGGNWLLRFVDVLKREGVSK